MLHTKRLSSSYLRARSGFLHHRRDGRIATGAGDTLAAESCQRCWAPHLATLLHLRSVAARMEGR